MLMLQFEHTLSKGPVSKLVLEYTYYKIHVRHITLRSIFTWGRFHQTSCDKRKDASTQRQAKNSPFNFISIINAKFCQTCAPFAKCHLPQKVLDFMSEFFTTSCVEPNFRLAKMLMKSTPSLLLLWIVS